MHKTLGRPVYTSQSGSAIIVVEQLRLSVAEAETEERTEWGAPVD